MRVYVVMGGTGGESCHVEVFAYSNEGYDKAVLRYQTLKDLNGGHWNLKLEEMKVQE